MGDVVALPLPGATALPDVRGEHRALQVTWHEHDGVFVISTWRLGQCVASVRLAPAEAAALVAVLADGLAQCQVEAPARPVVLPEPHGDLAERPAAPVGPPEGPGEAGDPTAPTERIARDA